MPFARLSHKPAVKGMLRYASLSKHTKDLRQEREQGREMPQTDPARKIGLVGVQLLAWRALRWPFWVRYRVAFEGKGLRFHALRLRSGQALVRLIIRQAPVQRTWQSLGKRLY